MLTHKHTEVTDRRRLTHRGHTQTQTHTQAQSTKKTCGEEVGEKDIRGHWGKDGKNIIYICMLLNC